MARKRSAKVKSPADGEIAEAIEKIEAWGRADSTAGYDHTLHSAVGSLLIRLASRRPAPLDPFLIPLA